MENYGTMWVCVDCIMHEANGECGGCYNGHDEEPLNKIDGDFRVSMGMTWGEHSCGREEGEDVLECDCETDNFSTYQCRGCGSYLYGERHAMTLYKV